jgi:acetyl-CoA synthetase
MAAAALPQGEAGLPPMEARLPAATLLRMSTPPPTFLPRPASPPRAVAAWAAARAELDGLPGGHGLNIAHEAVDRHARGPREAVVALRAIDRGGGVTDWTYRDLCDATARFANVLRELGVERGDLVCSLLGRVPALHVAALGTMKAGAVFSPLFSAFGPEPLQTRLELGRARVLVTTQALYRHKVAALRERLPDLRHVLLVDVEDEPDVGTHDLAWLLAAASATFEIPPTDPETPALIHFTSGTTGRPKAAVHVHAAVVAHHATARRALDLRPGDVFWCTADPGWVTGMSYGVVAPLTVGATSVVYEPEFDARRWYEVLREQQVAVWYTAPTAVRMLMRAGDALARAHPLPDLRFCASVGEPLNPECVLWSRDVLGHVLHDNWWQTETGGIMIGNLPGDEVRPGSMGRPLPGVEAGLVERRGDRVVEVRGPGAEGEIALRPGWPSMFRAYLGEPERYARCFADGWYLTGDLARRDADGYYWFLARGDDVIKSQGHLIGPFEVESALLEHPAVAEAGVIGVPDPVAGATVKAFVALRPGIAGDDALRRELLGFARQRLGAVVAPKAVEIVETVPRTRSGKVLRRLLRARELGLPEGDTSTLEQA